MLHTHKSLSLFPVFTHTFYFPPPPFLFHAALRGPFPSLMLDDVARGGGRVQSTNLMYDVHPPGQLQKPMLSRANAFIAQLSARN